MILAEHPTVQRFRETNRPGTAEPQKPLDAAWLRQLCLDCGADDAGLVEISRPALDDQRADILKFYPRTRALLAVVCRMNREPIRNPARSVANLEFHTAGEDVNDVCRAVVTHRLPRGVCFMYHAKDRHLNVPISQISGRRGGTNNSLTRITMKPTHMIGGYAQFSYAFNYYGPTGSQRDEVTTIRKHTAPVEYY